MADLNAPATPAKHSFGQLARRSMTDRSAPLRAAEPAPTPSEGAAAFDLRADELLEPFEERAAIMEFDGGMSRDDAEKAARLLHPLAPRG